MPATDAAATRMLNKKLSQIFRMRGLTVKPDAMQPLYDLLQGDDAWEQTLQAVLAEVNHQDRKGHVDAAAIRTAVATLRTRTSQKPTLSLETIDAFSMPRAKFDKQRRTLIPEVGGRPSLHAEASAKAGMHALRLQMVEQRVRRHDIFRPPVLQNGVAPKEHLEITGIDALLGRTGVHVVLGMLSEVESGCFALEDVHSSIPIDLSDAAITAGLFTRHAIVLAEGEVDASGTFKVSQLGMPAYEPVHRSLESLAGFDLLRNEAPSPTSIIGGAAASNAALAANQQTISSRALQNAMLLVLSDVWLDDPSVLKRLEVLLEGYEQEGAKQVGSGRAAAARASFFTIVLCGNFTSSHLAPPAAPGSKLKACFKDLADLIKKVSPTLAKHSRFILVPGPDDPTVGAPDILPRAPLPQSLCADLQSSVEHCELLTSPARLVLCGQHICIHREELLVKARRACVLPPTTDEGYDLNQHLIKSLIDQAHLCPLPPAEAAVYWQYEHALWMHPSPEVLILADRQHQFQHAYEETLAFNPGAFSSDLSWTVYYPGSKKVEESSLEP